MIKPELIGAEMTVKHKGANVTVKIVDNPEYYEFYRSLGFDIFCEPAKVTVIEKKKNARNSKGNN